MTILRHCSLLLALIAIMTPALVQAQASRQVQPSSQATASGIVNKRTTRSATGRVTTGKFRVFENRDAQSGKQIHLDFVVLHARNSRYRADPFFFFAGGPGQAVTSLADRFRTHWIRNERDIVLIDQRGTAGDHDLSFQFRSEGDVLQQFLEPVMDIDVVRENLDRLREQADLRMYSTPMAVDDVNDFRVAMGYRKINIKGGSYGTRFCLEYLRRHGDTVRSAILAGCAPIEFKNPLYHAAGAQRALDLIFAEVQGNERYRAAFGDLQAKFDEIVDRLRDQPVTVEIVNKATGNPEPVQMDLPAFLASVRFQMYYTAGNRDLPRLLLEAHQGNFRPFVVSALQQNIALRRSLALGMMLSVTSAEDLARIEESEIESATGDSFFGDARVRAQLAAGELWPKSRLPEGFDLPVKSEVPTLILSGHLDPVTPPQWGELIYENFPNSMHVVAPTAHDIYHDCVESIQRQFLDRGSVAGINTSCIKKMQLPALTLSK